MKRLRISKAGIFFICLSGIFSLLLGFRILFYDEISEIISIYEERLILEKSSQLSSPNESMILYLRSELDLILEFIKRNPQSAEYINKILEEMNDKIKGLDKNIAILEERMKSLRERGEKDIKALKDKTDTEIASVKEKNSITFGLVMAVIGTLIAAAIAILRDNKKRSNSSGNEQSNKAQPTPPAETPSGGKKGGEAELNNKSHE